MRTDGEGPESAVSASLWNGWCVGKGEPGTSKWEIAGYDIPGKWLELLPSGIVHSI
jgi:hypothetical protein